MLANDKLMRIAQVEGVYVDAVLTDAADRLVFLSLWGRDTGVQEFLARLSLTTKQGGLHGFWIDAPRANQCWSPIKYVSAESVGECVKDSARMPPNLFGAITQTWIFDPLAQQPDRSNGRAMLMSVNDPATEQAGARLWNTVRDVCHIPLLDHWRRPVLELCWSNNWLSLLTGINVHALSIKLPREPFEDAITDLIRQGLLVLEQQAA